MSTPHIHFGIQEFESRKQKTLAAMHNAGLSGLLLFKPESLYYLTGYDSFGFVFFQCLFLDADGNTTLLTRSADLRQAQRTSIVEDIQIWTDAPDANPAKNLLAILKDKGVQGKRLGVEYATHGLTAANGRLLDAALDGFCQPLDASALVSGLRVIKSETELQYARKAAHLADQALARAQQLTTAGAFEGDILAAMHEVIFKGGGDYPGNEFIIGSGDMALLCRSYVGRRHLSEKDQLTIEFAGAYRHYHAAMMRTLIVGAPSQHQITMHKVAVEALSECAAVLKPGNTLGDVFDAYAKVADKSGMKQHRLNATGYSLGATFYPTWMEEPVMYHGNAMEIKANMVLFVHIILMDSDTNTAMTTGHTFEIAGNKAIPLSQASLELVAKN